MFIPDTFWVPQEKLFGKVWAATDTELEQVVIQAPVPGKPTKLSSD